MPIVFKERIYKIWKQFTTSRGTEPMPAVLCSKNEYTKSESNSQPSQAQENRTFHCVQRTNIQNLKAIHNVVAAKRHGRRIVFKERIYKIWKQFTTMHRIGLAEKPLCSKNEYTKSESNSQPKYCLLFEGSIVFKERIYKIWKQFTTLASSGLLLFGLCSKNEYTKSESNSQHDGRLVQSRSDCVQRTNIQNLKAIHNCRWQDSSER